VQKTHRRSVTASPSVSQVTRQKTEPKGFLDRFFSLFNRSA
jgi:hypothetical protein